MNNRICTNCNVKLLKHRPNLFCCLCNTVKHYSCQGLSKTEAQYIQDNNNNGWICKDCIVDILPVNACNNKRTVNTASLPSFKAKCRCCGGMSYSQNSIKTCPWCDQSCHNRCINNTLGCTKCCEELIPGFHVNSYELIGDLYHKNQAFFNPYSNLHHANNIGDQFSQMEDDDTLWAEISQSLLNCKYKEPKNTKSAKNNELNVLSLNIRSLQNNLVNICDNASEYQKYDIMCFNETNCNINKLANGLDDLMIEGFHPPIVQSPARSSNRGGGLAVYVNTRVCQNDEINVIDLNFESPPKDGEFLFVKISSCKGITKVYYYR